MLHPVIAVDGTAASGKSTFSRLLAGRLGYVYVNTGLMYRGVTWHVLQRGIPLWETERVIQEVENAGVGCSLADGAARFFIGGADPESHVRASEVNAAVSLVAALEPVRRLLVAEQQSLAHHSPLVMEGRDIGTVVFPQTPYKFYLDASEAVRTQRRQDQGESDVIRQRDALDSGRKVSPLTCAADALTLDSGSFTAEELVGQALAHLKSRGLSVA